MAKRLGKGLNALIGDIDEQREEIELISIEEIRTNPYQPRKTFDADALEELKTSIETYGIIQPIIVRKSIKGYEIVAGERRYRAAKLANLTEVPAIVKDFDDAKMMEIALLENLQREDLTVIEEALAYKSLIEELKLTQDELSNKIGKSRSHISNTMRLLSLPEDVIAYVNSGQLSMGHARAILGLKKKDQLTSLVKRIIRDQLNVRQVEQLVQRLNEEKKPKKRQQTKKKDVFILRQEEILREHLGTNVKIEKNKQKGKIEIEFYSNEELEQLIDILKNN
ncbi:MAG TPA: ParB/RepB/Spo0J family partition protein [Pseudogracilibacillus sp.]|nr:ParB/RepB/Spo0J family partition protein [Pseudogracilibacillus sp.]